MKRGETPVSDQDDVAERCARIALAVIGQGDLDAAVADLHRLPVGLSARGKLAAGLIDTMLRSNTNADPARLRDLDGLLAVAEADPPSTPQWRRTRAAARTAALLRAAAERELSNATAALAEVDLLAAEVSDGDPGLDQLFQAARMGLTYASAMEDGDLAALGRLPTVSDNPAAAPLNAMLAASTSVMAAHQRGEDIGPRLAEMRQAAEALPAGHHLRDVVTESASLLDMFAPMMAGDASPALTDDQLAELDALTRRPGLGPADRAIAYSQAGMAALNGGREVELGRVDAAVAHLREAVRLAGPHDPHRVFHICGLAMALGRRNELTNATADLIEARDLLGQARTLAGGPRHPQWSMINEMLSLIGRLLGDTPDFHRDALDGLRGHVWRVLLQPDLAGVAATVRDVARDAVAIARQCLVAGDPAGAVNALDAGRGLALFAATEVGNVADRLEAAGRADVARRWRSAATSGDPAQLPTDLRRDVLTILSDHGSVATLLDPPAIGEIQQALATLDADALVYLMPRDGAIPGYAVITPAGGPPSYLGLPNLAVDDDVDVERYLAASAARDLAAPVSGGDLAGSLDKLCDWAWRAAIGPLIEAYLPRLPRAASGRPPRVFLVPMGDLARVPWQAARRRDGTYAVQLVAISQAASARMLCHTAGLAGVPLAPVGLVVGDPATGQAPDLLGARIEAYAVHQTFYRGARYVGRRPDASPSPSGPGSSDEVRGWLTTTGPAAGTMLHLACHGFLETAGSPTAYLLLAGGERLTAEELVSLMARAPDRVVALVVLAACRTGLSITGYDEAYSLGTAFLAGGARSVLSTQWSIPDTATSALMFMFHHYLCAEDLPVWAALRQAQLWMLDPDRQIPDRMPEPLRRRLDLAELDGVIAWAAFVHWGQ